MHLSRTKLYEDYFRDNLVCSFKDTLYLLFIELIKTFLCLAYDLFSLILFIICFLNLVFCMRILTFQGLILLDNLFASQSCLIIHSEKCLEIFKECLRGYFFLVKDLLEGILHFLDVGNHISKEFRHFVNIGGFHFEASCVKAGYLGHEKDPFLGFDGTIIY